MSRWQHAQCWDCWIQERGDEEPCRIKPEYATMHACCSCGKPTKSGIFIRRDGEQLPCQAKTGYHEEPE